MKTPMAGGGGNTPLEDIRPLMDDWSTVVKGKGKKHSSGVEVKNTDSDKYEERGIGRLARKLREGEPMEARKSNEIREGDWECKDQKCKWRNFSWRKHCMKCLKNPQGQKALGSQGASGGTPDMESALERARRIGERSETSRKHPKVLVLTINLLIENKTNVKPQLDDHYCIMKQAGLNLGEVKGKVGKAGYLEVALEPGAASAAGALREVSKIVNDKITILSIREQGSTREVLVRWQEVPFGILDETLYSYLELFSNPKRAGRNLWWEVCNPEEDMSPAGEMVGKWTGERTLMVTLKPGVGHIPVWHYVGGARIRLQVPGRRSCPRCLQAVGECKGGGNWDRCKKEQMPRASWKDEQAKFLKSVGWNEEQQKIMEGLQQNVPEEDTEEDDTEDEIRADIEQAERDADKRDGLVQRLETDKYCGGVFLKNFPEGTGQKKVEKQEALLTIITACNLTLQEQERLEDADVTLTRPERRRKGRVDVKIRMDQADGLMRKIWSQLEKPCREEGVKRYQIEASSPVTPARVKQLTGLQRARARVLEILKEEEDRKTQAEQVENPKEQDESQIEGETGIREKVEAAKETRVEEENHQQHKIQPQHSSLQSTVKEQGVQKENVCVRAPEGNDKDSEEKAQARKPRQATGSSSGSDITLRPGDLQAKETATEEEVVVRVKRQKWTPEAGFRRCGLQCQGCSQKCSEQGIEDCQNCHFNKTKKKNNNPCANRGECTDPKPAMSKKKKLQERKIAS